MFKSAFSLSTCLFLVVVFAPAGERAAAQSMPVHVPPPVPHPGPVVRAPAPHQPPCWQEAGISKSAMDERGAIQRRTRAEVEAVCADSSLSSEQRQQKIRQIHEQAKHEMDALVTPQQMEALKSCQMSRNHGGAHPQVPHPSAGGGHGPCGELASSPNPTNPPHPSPGGKPEAEVDH